MTRPKQPLPLLLAANLWIYGWLVLLTLGGLALSPLIGLGYALAGGRSLADFARLCVWIYGRAFLFVTSPFIRLEAQGLRRLGNKKPVILVINHLSFFDTYFMGALPHHRLLFVVRSWPFKMLWYLPVMLLAGYIDIEKLGWENGARPAKLALDSGVTLLFYPEGHRSRDGKMGRFHSGAFRLAVETGVPVVPLCIQGTDRLCPPGTFLLHPAHVRFAALDPVDPTAFTGETAHLDLKRVVKARINEALTASTET